MDRLRLEDVLISQAALWDENPKKHDIQVIWESIERHGFKDPPKFEPKLNGGKGGIVEGNGRLTCLQMMMREGKDRPRGVGEADGEWTVQILFGVDAESESAAQAYALDHNSSTMSGGDFDAFDMARMYDASYVPLLEKLDVLPVTVDGNTLDVMRSPDFEDWSDLDEQLEDLDGMEEISVAITVPAMHKDAVEEWLSDGDRNTAPGRGRGVLRRCELL